MYGFAVGDDDLRYAGGIFAAATELLSIASWTWSSRAEYPYADSISALATVMQNEMFYVFGGVSKEVTGPHKEGTLMSTIARYEPDNDTWTKLGDLNTARERHDAIITQGIFLIAGDSDVPTEKCQLKGDAMRCTDQEPSDL